MNILESWIEQNVSDFIALVCLDEYESFEASGSIGDSNLRRISVKIISEVYRGDTAISIPTVMTLLTNSLYKRFALRYIKEIKNHVA